MVLAGAGGFELRLLLTQAVSSEATLLQRRHLIPLTYRSQCTPSQGPAELATRSSL
jgi:hypothetical protein